MLLIDKGGTGEIPAKAGVGRFGDIEITIYDNIRKQLSPWGTVTINEETRTFFVKDTPEIISLLEQQIESIDVAPDNIRLTFFIFKASKTGTSGSLSELPQGVREGLDQVKEVMAYKSFNLENSGMLTILSTGRRGGLSLSNSYRIDFAMDYNQGSKLLMLALDRAVGEGGFHAVGAGGVGGDGPGRLGDDLGAVFGDGELEGFGGEGGTVRAGDCPRE